MEQSPNPLNSAWLRMQGAAVVFIFTSLQHQHMGPAWAREKEPTCMTSTLPQTRGSAFLGKQCKL